MVGVASAVSAPVEVLREYIETELLLEFATYTDVPSGETVTLYGPEPAAIVGVARAVKAPVVVLREYR